MKQGTSQKLPIRFTGIDLSTVESIEFVFTQIESRTSQPLKTATWIRDNENETAYKHPTMNDVILIPWSIEDTYAFKEGRSFYLDTRIHLSGSTDNPATPIIPLKMTPTLFDEEVTDNDSG